VATPLQEAVAVSLEESAHNNFIGDLAKEYQQLRDSLFGILQNSGLEPCMPHGGYFILADTSKVPDSPSKTTTPSVEGRRDYRICRWLTTDVGVCAIPISSFYEANNKEGRENVAGFTARFAFCKAQSMISEAGKRLQRLKTST
jgi:kynurenine aminotransferase